MKNDLEQPVLPTVEVKLYLDPRSAPRNPWPTDPAGGDFADTHLLRDHMTGDPSGIMAGLCMVRIFDAEAVGAEAIEALIPQIREHLLADIQRAKEPRAAGKWPAA